MKNKNNHYRQTLDDLGNTRRKLRTTSKIHFPIGASFEDEEGNKPKKKTTSTRTRREDDTTTTTAPPPATTSTTSSTTETTTTRTIDTAATSSTEQEAEEEAPTEQQQQSSHQHTITIIRFWVRLILLLAISTGLFATIYISWAYGSDSSYNKSVSCSVYDCDCNCQKHVVFENRNSCPSDENSNHDHERMSFVMNILAFALTVLLIVFGAYWIGCMMAELVSSSFDNLLQEVVGELPCKVSIFWVFSLLFTATYASRLFIIVTTFMLWGGGTPKSQHSDVNKDCPLYVYNSGDSCYKYESFENYQNCADDSTRIIHNDDVQISDDFSPGLLASNVFIYVLIMMLGMLSFICVCVMNCSKRKPAEDSSKQQESLPKASANLAPIVQRSFCFGSSSTMTIECLKYWIRLILVITIFTGIFAATFILLTIPPGHDKGGHSPSMKNSTCSVYDCDCDCEIEVLFENRSKCPGDVAAGDGDSFHDEYDTMSTFIMTLFGLAGMFLFSFCFVGILLNDGIVEERFYRDEDAEYNPMIFSLRKTILIIWSLLLFFTAAYAPRLFITIFTLGGRSEDSDHANEDCRYVYNSGGSCYKYEMFDNNQNCPDSSRVIRKDDVDLIDPSISPGGCAFVSCIFAFCITSFIAIVIDLIICCFLSVVKKFRDKLGARTSDHNGYMTTSTQIV